MAQNDTSLEKSGQTSYNLNNGSWEQVENQRNSSPIPASTLIEEDEEMSKSSYRESRNAFKFKFRSKAIRKTSLLSPYA